MRHFGSDAARFDWICRNLYVPVVCDVLDGMGRRHQAMHQRLRPICPEQCTFAGRARTVRWMETDYVIEQDPYGLEIDIMDSLRPGDVIVHSTDAGGTNAPWGELMSTVAVRRGAVGCVCDSNVRDCRKIMSLGFPVFCAGIRPVDSLGRGRVVAFDVPVRCGEVLTSPGELVFADYDGVVVVPKDVEDEVLERAADKVGRETASRRELTEGKLLRDVYAKYGVLQKNNITRADSTMSWSDYVRDDLRACIRGGNGLPARLTLHGLSRRYGVSITPVRSAVEALLAEGLLLRESNGRLAVNAKKVGSRPAARCPAPPLDRCEEIARDLIALSLREGPLFVREEATADRYGMGAAAVREAFHRLAGMGVLIHLPRRGWQLRPFRRKDFDDYLNVREVLELTALDQAWPRLDDVRLGAIYDRNRLPAKDGRPAAIDDSLHAYIIETADNVYIGDFFERHGRYFRALFEWDADQSDRDAAVEAVRQHRKILSAILRRDRRAARKALSHHIRTNYGRLKEFAAQRLGGRANDGTNVDRTQRIAKGKML